MLESLALPRCFDSRVNCVRRARKALRMVVAAVCVLSLFRLAAAEPRRLTLPEAVSLARQHNLNLKRSRSEIEAAKGGLAGADVGMRYNPYVGLTGGPRLSNAGRSAQYGIEVFQQFEVGGQRAARVDVAQSTVNAAEAQTHGVEASTIAEVRQQFGTALAAGQRLQLAKETLSLITEGSTAAQARVEAGSVPRMELNTALIELGRAKLAYAKAQGEQAAALSRLRLLIGLTPGEPIEVTGALGDSQQLVEDVNTLTRRALSKRAELRYKTSVLEAARAQERLLEKELVPSPKLGASLMREEETDASIIQVLLSFDMPVFNRNVGQRRVAEARVQQEVLALDAAERQIKEEVVVAVARLQAAIAAVDGYASDIIVAMNENLEFANESYRAGKIDFMELFVVRRQAVEARREYIAVLEELNGAWAELDRAVGGY